MAVLTSSLDTAGETYRANRAAQLALLDQLERAARAGHRGRRGALRSNATAPGASCWPASGSSCCVDPDSPFLELSSLAAWGTQFTVGASLITGIGVVSGVECVIIAQRPDGTRRLDQPVHAAQDRCAPLEIARANRLPVVNLVESGGADLPTQADLFVPAGRIFRELTELSAVGIPTIALVFGNSTAGGAYVPGMC